MVFKCFVITNIITMVSKNEQTVMVYDKIARNYAKIFDYKDSSLPYLGDFLASVKSATKDDFSILDLGCGTGRIAQFFSDKGCEVTGLDLSKKMIEIARKKHPKIKFLHKDMTKINFADKSFNAVSIVCSLFHLEKKQIPELITKVHRMLKENGFLLIIIHEGEGETFIDEPLSPGEKIFVSLFSEKEITTLLVESGFEIEKINRKKPKLKGELPFNKLIIIAKKIRKI